MALLPRVIAKHNSKYNELSAWRLSRNGRAMRTRFQSRSYPRAIFIYSLGLLPVVFLKTRLKYA